MHPVLVDTNVLVIANEASGRSTACAKSCAERLHSLQIKGQVVLDLGRVILKQYADNVRRPGQPGIGFIFFKWLLNTAVSYEQCCYVELTPHDTRGFEEFPEHSDLLRFDWADRVFVAASIKHPDRVPILQASDSKWVGWSPALKECGVDVDFVCLADIRDLVERRSKRQRKLKRTH